MSTQKIFVFDIDGTLVNDNKQILDSTKEAIKQLMDNNHIVILNTGRTAIQTKQIMDELNLKDYLVGNNGTSCYDIKNNSYILSENIIDKKTKKVFYKRAKELKRELIFSNGIKFWRVYFGKNPLEEIKDPKYFIGGSSKLPIYDDWKKAKKDFFKERLVLVTLKVETSLLEQEMNYFKSVIDDKYSIYETSRVYIQASNKNNDKWTGLKILIDKNNWDVNDIYCFGDSENDFSMIKNCPNGVAMENSEQYLKDVAKYTIGNNNQDSIYNFLKKMGYIK